ncbi:hypothetical protein ACHAXT_012722 [Thalassiosira profunda]
MARPTATSSMDDDAVVESLIKAQEYHLDSFGDTSSDHRTSVDKFRDAAHGIRHYKKGEAATIRRVLDEMEVVSAKRTSEGFNELNFSIGVFNCVSREILGQHSEGRRMGLTAIQLLHTYQLFVAYMFGAHPEHLWLIYLLEGCYMIPRKFYNMWHARPLNQALYYLDFCWCANFTGIFFLGALLFIGHVTHNEGVIGSAAREAFFNAIMGVACGALMGANIVLPFVACLFHDVNTMTGLFIHLMPPMVMYTFMWHAQDIKTAWPEVFQLTYLENVHYFPEEGLFFAPGTGLDSVCGNSIVLYLLWWIPYVIFMLLVGIDLPKKFQNDGITPANPKWDTVFHSTMRGGVCISIGKVFRGRSKKDSLKLMEANDFDLVDFFTYMGFHLLAAVSSFYLIGYPCFRSQNFHLFMLIFVAWLGVTRGASRYTYYTTKMYSRTLRKQFAGILDEAKKE